MRSTLRVAAVVVVVAMGPGAPAQDQAPSPRPSPARRRRPIHDSVERVVDRVVQAHLQPCGRAGELGVPCFPVSVEQEGPRFSVADALRRYRATGSPSPSGPLTVAETQSHLSGAPLSPSANFGSFDPVCTTKNLVKKLSGKNTTFHLYRIWDARGEHPLLTDQVLDPKAYAANLDFHYEYLGKFDGECEAVAAWRKALREATEPKPVPDDAWDESKDSPEKTAAPEPP